MFKIYTRFSSCVHSQFNFNQYVVNMKISICIKVEIFKHYLFIYITNFMHRILGKTCRIFNYFVMLIFFLPQLKQKTSKQFSVPEHFWHFCVSFLFDFDAWWILIESFKVSVSRFKSSQFFKIQFIKMFKIFLDGNFKVPLLKMKFNYWSWYKILI